MSIIDDLEELAIGARLKRVHELFAKNVTQIYKDEGLDFEPKYFTLFYLINKQGEAGVTEIADELGLTHPGVIHLAKELEGLGYIESIKSTTDSRKRMLRLSAKGTVALPQLERIWEKIRVLNQALFHAQQHNLLSAIKETEKQLYQINYYNRFQQMFNITNSSGTSILTYNEKLAPYFKTLNIEWINTYFTVEEHDLEQLNHPRENIIDGGGEIFFAQINQDIVGTCALIKTGDKEYELAKMGVSPKYQGRKIANLLMEASLAKARQLGAQRVWLGSNRRLTPALALYRKFGFTEYPGKASAYQRADIHMELLMP